mgnify:CR=1 FL=1
MADILGKVNDGSKNVDILEAAKRWDTTIFFFRGGGCDSYLRKEYFSDLKCFTDFVEQIVQTSYCLLS